MGFCLTLQKDKDIFYKKGEESMNGASLDIVRQRLKELEQIIPECFTEGTIDWEKLRVFFGEQIEFKNERYHLNWAGKSEAYRLLQTPTYKTLKPCREESFNFDETENVFIEGDNLEVLKALQKAYFGKIKMIYIDPPYNTGNDFIYKDDFSQTLAEYKKRVGDIDEEGNATKAGLFKNTKENGQYHSNWLNMMLPRLFLARNLLRDDGVIFVSIDDNEVHNLRLLMDEIFGEENFVVNAIWEKVKIRKNSAKWFSDSHDHILIYCKNKEVAKRNLIPRADLSNYKNPDNDPRGLWIPIPIHANHKYDADYKITKPNGVVLERPKNNYWRLSEKKFNEYVKDNRIWWGEGDSYPMIKRFLSEVQEGLVPKSIFYYDEVGGNPHGDNEVKMLFNGAKYFDNPKSVGLIKKFLQISTNPINQELILDFFAGSATIAHAVMELNKEDDGNRKYILVQLPEPTDLDSEAYKAGYKTIADIAKERIRRAAQKIQQEIGEEQKKKTKELQFEPQEEKKLDLGFKVFKLDESNFKQWRPFVPENPEEIKLTVLEFEENIKPESTVENMLYELMLKNGKKLTDKIEKKNKYYVINENELVLLLESVDKSVIDDILKLKPQKVIALDKLFNGNDQLKTNTVLQFKDAGIEFKSV